MLSQLAARLMCGAGRVPILSTILRNRARHFREGSVVTIRAGLACGLKWCRHHRYINGYWLGTHELPMQQALARLLRPGDVFCDVGANAGFFSILGARLVGPKGHVFAFEPLAENRDSIREQLELNRIDWVEIVPMAAGAHEGRAAFSYSEDANSMAHLGPRRCADERTVSVDVTTLDAFSAGSWLSSVIKIDVEGTEADVLDGAREIAGKGARFAVELHGRDAAEDVVRFFSDRSYRLERLDGTPARTPRAEQYLVAQR